MCYGMAILVAVTCITTIQIVASSLKITRECISKLEIFIRACITTTNPTTSSKGLVVHYKLFTTSNSLVTRLVA